MVIAGYNIDEETLRKVKIACNAKKCKLLRIKPPQSFEKYEFSEDTIYPPWES